MIPLLLLTLLAAVCMPKPQVGLCGQPWANASIMISGHKQSSLVPTLPAIEHLHGLPQMMHILNMAMSCIPEVASHVHYPSSLLLRSAI